MNTITSISALELGKMLKMRQISVKEAVEEQLNKIGLLEAEYNCYITINEEDALKRAEEIQKKLDQGYYNASPLAGVPVAIKDNICTKGILTSCGSKLLSNFIPPYNATVIERLNKAGAIIIGKTNMDEFAMGSSNETSYYGITKNPRNPDHVPGGSSGGSAAAVAADEAFYSLGTDTGGSIRQPAAYCGITGLKPTYGTVSRYGLIAYASSLDQIGPMGKNISDCAAALEVISGHDPKDSTSAKTKGYSYMDALVNDVKGMRIGVPKGYLGDCLNNEVRERLNKVIELYRENGAIVEEFDLELIESAVPAYYVIACAEASSNLSRFDGVKYGIGSEHRDSLQDLYKNTRSDGFGEEVKRRIMAGAFVVSSDNYETFYLKAMKVRSKISEAFIKAFNSYDIILGPTVPQTAPKIGESSSQDVKVCLTEIYTVSVNLAGLPAVSVPCGISKDGLPIGFQLIGRPFGERDIIRAAYSFEQSIK